MDVTPFWLLIMLTIVIVELTLVSSVLILRIPSKKIRPDLKNWLFRPGLFVN